MQRHFLEGIEHDDEVLIEAGFFQRIDEPFYHCVAELRFGVLELLLFAEPGLIRCCPDRRPKQRDEMEIAAKKQIERSAGDLLVKLIRHGQHQKRRVATRSGQVNEIKVEASNRDLKRNAMTSQQP